MSQLPEQLYSQIQDLCAAGDEFAESNNFPEALRCFWEAWDLLPEPANQWEAAMWILAAIGDANFLSNDFVAGSDNLSLAMSCPDAVGNPFLHLRLGQCEFELGNLVSAVDELMRAYMAAGSEIFSDQDPKYLKFLKTQAVIR